MKLRFLLAAASMLAAVQTYAGGLSQYVNPFIGASTSIDAAGGTLELWMGPEPSQWGIENQ